MRVTVKGGFWQEHEIILGRVLVKLLMNGWIVEQSMSAKGIPCETVLAVKSLHRGSTKPWDMTAVMDAISLPNDIDIIVE